jgi:hypothetical protein
MTLGFTGFPNGMIMTDQYADLGAVFTDGHDNGYHNPSFKNDGVGLDGNGDFVVAFSCEPLAAP